MIIFPAIDIKGGQCVRLFQGDFSTAEQVADSPVETALSFAEAGAQWIHMVDLDGALAGERVNSSVFTEVAAKTPLKVELGGGIRTMKDISFYLEEGISRVILGSAALKNPAFVLEAVREFGSQVAVGIDAQNGYAATEGWTESSRIHYIDFAKQMEEAGVQTIIYTDISKDGTLAGPNIEQLAVINNAVSCNIIASGGITNIGDIAALKKLGLYGAICGKSIYKGTLSLKEAVALCRI